MVPPPFSRELPLMEAKPPDGSPTPTAVELGRAGERLAAAHLEHTGWTILARNFRAGRKEVDLVVRRGATVAFVEVKSRRGSGFGHPLEAITWRKRREIAEVARHWWAAHPGAGRIYRFDAVAVVFEPSGGVWIEHVEDAWRRHG